VSVLDQLKAEGLPPELEGSADLIWIPYRDQSRRSAAQRLGLTAPAAYLAAARAARGMPVGSRQRRFLFRRALADALAAYNRRDWQAMLLSVADDVEVFPPAGVVALGLERSYRGHDDYLSYQHAWIELWGEFKVIPAVALDLGERMVVLGRMGGGLRRAGAPVDSEFGSVDTFHDAKLVRQEVFLSHREALTAAEVTLDAM
jgi:hypothetical protein